MYYRFPGIVEAFGGSSAAFWKAGVTNASFVGKYFSPGSFQRFPDSRGIGFTDPLIALTMIVGTYVEVDMVFPVIPVNQFFVGTNQRVGFLSG